MTTSDPHSVPEALERALRDLGRRVSENPDRVRAVLSDSLGGEAREHRAEIDAIVLASEEGIPASLIDRSEIAATESDVVQDDQRMLDRLAERGLNPDAAAFALGTWASALGTATSVTSTPMIEPAASGSLGSGTADGESTDVRADLAATALPTGPPADVLDLFGTDRGTPEDDRSSRRRGGVRTVGRTTVAGAAASALLLVAAVVWATTLRNPGEELELADGRTTTTSTPAVTPTITTTGPATTTATPTKSPTKATPTTKTTKTTKTSAKPPRVIASTTPRRSTPTPAKKTTPVKTTTKPKTTPKPPAPKTLKAGSTSYAYAPLASNNGGPCGADVGTPANWCRSNLPAIKSGTVSTWSVSSAYSANGHGNVTFSGHTVYYDPHHNGAFSDVVYYRLSGSGVTSNWGSFRITMSCNTNYQCY